MLRMIKSDRILLESDYCNLKKLDAQVCIVDEKFEDRTNIFLSSTQIDDGNFRSSL